MKEEEPEEEAEPKPEGYVDIPEDEQDLGELSNQ